jgi:hypothetical protein
MEDEDMARKRHTADEIVAKLRQVDVLTAQGRTVAEAIRLISVTEVAPRRTPARRDLLRAQEGSDRDRKLAARQHHPSAIIAGLQTTRARGGAMVGGAIPVSATGLPSGSAKTNHALTLISEHLLGLANSTRSPSPSGSFLVESVPIDAQRVQRRLGSRFPLLVGRRKALSP